MRIRRQEILKQVENLFQEALKDVSLQVMLK